MAPWHPSTSRGRWLPRELPLLSSGSSGLRHGEQGHRAPLRAALPRGRVGREAEEKSGLLLGTVGKEPGGAQGFGVCGGARGGVLTPD